MGTLYKHMHDATWAQRFHVSIDNVNFGTVQTILPNLKILFSYDIGPVCLRLK
jgi:hypothetical protein